jgi:hypothetical protein
MDSPLLPYEDDTRWHWVFGRLAGADAGAGEAHVSRRAIRRSTLRSS